jgi:hypothetical protein
MDRMVERSEFELSGDFSFGGAGAGPGGEGNARDRASEQPIPRRRLLNYFLLVAFFVARLADP